MDFKHEVVIPNEDLPFRMFLFEGMEGNYKVAKHWHDSVELFLVREGSMDFYINSHHVCLEPHQFMLVNCNEVHSIDCPHPNNTVVLQIPITLFKGYSEQGSYINFEKKDEKTNKQLAVLVETMFLEYEQRGYGYFFQVMSSFYQLLHLLVTSFQAESVDAAVRREKRQLDRLSKVTQFMEDNYDQELKLEEVADRFGFSPTYLSRMFQKYAHINYRAYLIDIRVTHAVRELMNTDHEIGAIAMEHGFPDSRAFAKAFRKRYGCLPSQYRKRGPSGPSCASHDLGEPGPKGLEAELSHDNIR